MKSRSLEFPRQVHLPGDISSPAVANLPADSFVGRILDADAGVQPSPTAKIDGVPLELANHPDYRITRELGRGGMSVVYLAKNVLMDRDETKDGKTSSTSSQNKRP